MPEACVGVGMESGPGLRAVGELRWPLMLRRALVALMVLVLVVFVVALAFHGDIDFNMKPEMQGYRWPAIATRLEQMQRSPDRLFPPIVEQRLTMPVMDQSGMVVQQKAPAPKQRGPKL